MEGSRKFIRYISDSIANLSSMMTSSSASSSQYTPTVEGEENRSRIPLSLIGVNESGKSLDNSLEWSREDDGNGTVVVRAADYEQMQCELSANKTVIEELRRKERESEKMLRNYDRTLTYVLEERRNKGTCVSGEDGGSEEISRLRHSEQRLKSHVQALKKDLFISEERAEAFKQIAKEKIDDLTREVERLRGLYEDERRRASEVRDKLVRAEGAARARSEEGVELVEYCKYLLG